MAEGITAYPLCWPVQKPRTNPLHRKDGQFGKRVQRAGYSWRSKERLTLRNALDRLYPEIDRIGGINEILSTNLRVRMDGQPKGGQAIPSDPGVCLYFQMGEKNMCMPCDTFNRIEDNIAALAAHIEAIRKIERLGVQTVEEMFTGFQALPAPGQAESEKWWNALGVSPEATADEIKRAYRERAKQYHSDVAGGNDAAMAQLNVARDQALKERGNG